MNQNTLNIVIIGAGNLATHLARALVSTGVKIHQIYSRTETSAKTLANEINAKYTTSIDAIKNDADIYFFAIKDSVLPDFLNQLNFKDGLFIHTAGSVSMDVFKDHSSRYGVFYPMQTFSKNKQLDFLNIPVFIESNNKKDLDLLNVLGDKISNKVVKLDSEQRKRMHVAAVFTSNFTNHMYALAELLMQDANLDFELMLPLIKEGADKVLSMSPKDAQTGPAIRYDQSVINKHIALLKDRPEMQSIYENLSKSIHELNKTKDVEKEF